MEFALEHVKRYLRRDLHCDRRRDDHADRGDLDIRGIRRGLADHALRSYDGDVQEHHEKHRSDGAGGSASAAYILLLLVHTVR